MITTIHGECMMLAWGESHSRGATVTLLLSDPSDLEPFKRLTLAKGKIAGQRLMYALAEIGEDELPKNIPIRLSDLPESELKDEDVQEALKGGGLKGGPLCKLSAILSNDPKFWAWVASTEYGGIGSADDAASYIRSVCKINSRRELDHNPVAAYRFHERIRLPYLAYNDGVKA